MPWDDIKADKSALHVAEISTPAEGLAWDQYVLGHALGTGYHLMGWRRVIEEAFGHRTFYLMAKDDRGGVQGVLPLVFLASRLFGRFLVSMSFVNYGGLLADTAEAQGAMLGEAVRLATDLKASHIELRQQASLDLEWPSKQHKVSMRLELPDHFAMLSNRFPSKLRSQIRRAQKEGMSAHTGGREILDDLHRVFSRNMRDLGIPVYGRSFFETMLRVFPKETRIVIVYLSSKPLAAAFLYGFRTLLEIPWASSDRRYNHLAPNMLLYNVALEYACREGFRVFDFGRSSKDSGTLKFKKQWGGHEKQLYWYYDLPEGEPLPNLNPSSKKFGTVISVWKKIPVTLTNIIGPSIVKNLP